MTQMKSFLFLKSQTMVVVYASQKSVATHFSSPDKVCPGNYFPRHPQIFLEIAYFNYWGSRSLVFLANFHRSCNWTPLSAMTNRLCSHTVRFSPAASVVAVKKQQIPSCSFRNRGCFCKQQVLIQCRKRFHSRFLQ